MLRLLAGEVGMRGNITAIVISDPIAFYMDSDGALHQNLNHLTGRVN